MTTRIPPIFLSHHHDHQIEAEEGRDGIYRLSGQASHIQALKQQFDNGEVCTQIFKQRNCKKTTNNIFDNGLYTNLLNNTIANKTTDNKILNTSKHKYRENNQTRYFE